MTVFRLVILLLLFSVVWFLAVNSYQQWKSLVSPRPAEQNSPIQEDSHFFTDAQASYLTIEADELQRELQFNLWADQQHILARRLISNIKHRIELRPFYARYWLELVNAQQQYGLDQSEYSGNLINAIRQNGWQIKAFTILAYHCIHQKPVLSKAADAECRALLSQPFAATAIGNVRYHLGIEKQRFEQILQEARATR